MNIDTAELETLFASFAKARDAAHAADPMTAMNELERARKTNFGAVWADCKWEDQLEAEQKLFDEAYADTAEGAWADARDYEAARRERDSL